MTTIVSTTNATAVMKALLGRDVSPLDIALRPECTVMSVMRPELMVGSASVGRIANLADPDSAFVQANALAQGAAVSDTGFGRDTLGFDGDFLRHYVLDAPVAVSGAFSLLSVFQIGTAGQIHNILGDESSITSDRYGINVWSNNTVRARVGDGFAQSGAISLNTWHAAIMSYDGTNTVKLEVLGAGSSTGAVTSEANNTTLRLGDQTPAFGLHGRVDMAAMFNVDMFDPSQAAVLADVKTMLRQFYGSLVSGVA